MKKKFVHRESRQHKDAKEIARDSFSTYFPRVYDEYPLSNESIMSGWIGKPPTYQQCKDMNSDPFAVVDVMCCGVSGKPKVGVEICWTNEVPKTKINRFCNNHYPNGFVLLEYDATTILNSVENHNTFIDQPINIWVWGEPFLPQWLEEILDNSEGEFSLREELNEGQRFLYATRLSSASYVFKESPCPMFKGRGRYRKRYKIYKKINMRIKRK
jgi:hypothetical protein